MVRDLPKNWSSFAKKLARLRDLPKFWSEIYQNFGCSFAKILVVHSPKFWSLIFGGLVHLPKFWSFICQKIGPTQRFTKKLVFVHSPKFWSLIFGGLVHSPKNWSLFIRQKIGKLIRQNFGCSRLSLAKILVAKQMIDIFQFLEHNPDDILPIYNQEPLTKYQLKQLTQYEQNK